MKTGKLKTTNAKKHEAVIEALKDSFWTTKSDRAIAGHVGVSHTYVANVRREVKEGGKIRMSFREYLRQARRMATLPVGFLRRTMSSETSVREEEQKTMDRLARQLYRVRYGGTTNPNGRELPPTIRPRRLRRPRQLNSRRKKGTRATSKS
jgi:hypothetical protein